MFVIFTSILQDLLCIIFCISINNRTFVSVLAALKEGTTVPFSFALLIASMKIEEIKQITEQILETKSLFLVDLTMSKDNVIEIFIDAQAGVSIQTCMEVSREIEQHFDRETEDFELTVASAGIGYPFKVEGQYQKNVGKSVEVKLNDNTKLTGILKSFTPETVTLEYEEKRTVEGKKKKESVKTEKTIDRNEIKQIKDLVTF